MDGKIEAIARAIVQNDGKCLMCKVKTKTHWFFPGGHMEEGETAEEALRREISEEIGKRIEVGELIGIVENFFQDPEGNHHEINLAFSGRLADSDGQESALEDHLEFGWFSLEQLESLETKPQVLKEEMIKWMRTGKFFHEVER